MCTLYLGPYYISVFAFGYRQRQKTAAKIHTAVVVAVLNVNCGFKHRVHEIFCGEILILCIRQSDSSLARRPVET